MCFLIYGPSTETAPTGHLQQCGTPSIPTPFHAVTFHAYDTLLFMLNFFFVCARMMTRLNIQQQCFTFSPLSKGGTM